MHPERGLGAAVGLVLAFTIVWTIAILVPDNGATATQSQPFGLVVNGTHYVLDKNVGRYPAQDDENVQIIHSASPPTITKRKLKGSSSSTNTKVTRNLRSQPSSEISASDTTSNSSSTKQKKAPLFPRWAWLAILVLINAKNARRFLKKEDATYHNDLAGDDWFVKSGLDSKLVYYGDREYEDDFLSVDGSFYGSIGGKWSGEELDKFDVDV